jgi:hypothetical protein
VFHVKQWEDRNDARVLASTGTVIKATALHWEKAARYVQGCGGEARDLDLKPGSRHNKLGEGGSEKML